MADAGATPPIGKMAELIRDLKECENKSRYDFSSKYERNMIKILNEFTEEEKKNIGDLFEALLRNGDSSIIGYVANPIFDKRKLIDWKNSKNLVDRIVDLIKVLGCEEGVTHRHYTGFMEKLITTLTSNQVVNKHAKKIHEIIQLSLTDARHSINSPIHTAALTCITKFPWTDNEDLIPETIKMLKDVVLENPDLPEGAWLYTDCSMIMCISLRELTEKSVHKKILPDVAEMFNFCANQEWMHSEDPSKKNICYAILRSVMEDYLSNGGAPPELLKPMMASVRELWQCGDEILQRDANYIMTAVAQHPELVGDDIDELLDRFFQGKLATIGYKLMEMYNSQPDKFTPYLPKLLEMLETTDQPFLVYIMQLFSAVAKTSPQLLPPKIVPAAVKHLTHTNNVYVAISFLDAYAEKCPDQVLPYEEEILKHTSPNETTTYMAGGLLTKLAKDEVRQRKYLNFFALTIQKVANTPIKIGFMSYMRVIGVNCPKILAEHKKYIEELRNEAALKDMSQSLLDVIEGRSLEGVAKDVSEQQKEIAVIDSRVTTTEENVSNLSKTVDENKEEVGQVKTDVARQTGRIDELKEVVDETVDKVEELDHKTLSHAPSWSRDVSKLLNPEADHDWRLLASRLGYSHDDIRNWATQPDPCLSMLDEWFATHRTREATYGVLKTLVEMDRTDASVIVDKALQSVEDIVDDDDGEPAVAPLIFLSYQWAHQPEVKLLKRHLAMAGYSSWMDIGQMGGGDKLFAKIDAGIRAAKVVVCCVTERYAESPNCNREVNLSVTLGKPIIPLLMEKIPWPPPGSMGPIFGEYIFVRFFQREEEKLGPEDDRYWATDKFTELLMQLRYTIAPDASLITTDSAYRNWWQPPEEIISVAKRNPPKSNTASSVKPVENGATSSSQSPEVFISYQWDKQTQIKALYRRLSELGYTCWLDIMQMGGGDSLFDKIDRGIRGCKVVLSCVTSKYALSANCRREVSLADAIKKPIIPLLLEKVTWPPEGPMGMILTQLLYIDFCKPTVDIQNDWKCAQFNDLLKRIDPYFTKVVAASGPVTTTKESNNPANNSPKKENEPPVEPRKPSAISRTDSKLSTSQTSQSCILI